MKETRIKDSRSQKCLDCLPFLLQIGDVDLQVVAKTYIIFQALQSYFMVSELFLEEGKRTTQRRIISKESIRNFIFLPTKGGKIYRIGDLQESQFLTLASLVYLQICWFYVCTKSTRIRAPQKMFFFNFCFMSNKTF